MGKNWISFQAVKAAVPMEAALARYGVKLRRVNGTCLRGTCPLSSHGSKSSTQSFLVQTVKNLWACHSASCVAARGGGRGGSVLDFVAAVEGCSLQEAAVKLEEWFLTAAQHPAESLNPSTKPGPSAVSGWSNREGEDSGPANRPLTFTLKGVDSSHRYLAKRGITNEAAAHFGAGFYAGRGSMSRRIVIPIHDDRGTLVAYAGRATAMRSRSTSFRRTSRSHWFPSTCTGLDSREARPSS